MLKTYKKLKKKLLNIIEEFVPTHTVAAAFSIATILGIIVVSGVLLKPYEARDVVLDWHERILTAKENREIARIHYSADNIAAFQDKVVTVESLFHEIKSAYLNLFTSEPFKDSKQ